MYLEDDADIKQTFHSDFVKTIEMAFECSEHSFNFMLYVTDSMREQGEMQLTTISNLSNACDYLEFMRSLKKCMEVDGIAIATSWFYGAGNTTYVVVADD